MNKRIFIVGALTALLTAVVSPSIVARENIIVETIKNNSAVLVTVGAVGGLVAFVATRVAAKI